MDNERIKRINELYRKSKNEGLTEEEKNEQSILRAEYIADFRKNMRTQLNQIRIIEPDGSITDLGEKHGDNS